MKWFHSRRSSDTPDKQQEQIENTAARNALNTTAGVETATQGHPTVIEVFQSQGCNSCPPTNSLLLSKMAQEDPDALILDYHVTYWDYLGWRDPFGVREADEHQRQYAHARGTSRVYTPQVVVNGLTEGVGNSRGSLEKLIEGGSREASKRAPWLSFRETQEGILIQDSGTSSTSTQRQGRIIEIVYDPVPHDIHIPRGENAGKTLTQRNTVKSVKDLGTWSNGQGPLRLAPADESDGLKRVLMVQDGLGGPIIGISPVIS